jgi:hypothetical protein
MSFLKSMTVNQLHKILGELVAKNKGRMHVCIDKDTFQHPLEEDGCTIIDVKSGAIEDIEISSDDGGAEFNKDGTIRHRHMFVMKGGAR